MHTKLNRYPERTPGIRIKRSYMEKISGYTFILPALIFLLGFVGYPLIYNIVISFYDVNVETLNGIKPFIGLSNYIAIINTPVFRTALFNTFYFTFVCIVFQFTIGYGLALLFSKKFFGNEFTRGILLVCWLVPNIVVATVWKWMFGGDTSGIINYLLLALKLIDAPIVWMTSTSGAMWALIITNIWRGIPFNMLLLATALTTLPGDVFEAAEIDGASKIQRFIKITVPLMKPTIITVITLGFIYTFKTFELIYVMTGGGPANATEILATVSYRFAFTNFDFGQGSATANILFLILMVFGIVYLKFVEKDEVIS